VKIVSFNKQTALLQRSFKPKEVSGGTLESTIKVGVNKALREYELSTSVMSKEFVDQISQKWGSINEDFKATYRATEALDYQLQMLGLKLWLKTILDILRILSLKQRQLTM
jgi:hypothetical protein